MVVLKYFCIIWKNYRKLPLWALAVFIAGMVNRISPISSVNPFLFFTRSSPVPMYSSVSKSTMIASLGLRKWETCLYEKLEHDKEEKCCNVRRCLSYIIVEYGQHVDDLLTIHPLRPVWRSHKLRGQGSCSLHSGHAQQQNKCIFTVWSADQSALQSHFSRTIKHFALTLGSNQPPSSLLTPVMNGTVRSSCLWKSSFTGFVRKCPSRFTPTLNCVSSREQTETST